MMEYGMPTLIEHQTLDENITLCRQLGLSFIELNMNFPEYQLDRLEQVTDFIEKAHGAGIYYTIHLDENLNIADFNPLVRQAYLETVRRTIEIAKQLVPLKNKHGRQDLPLIINMHLHPGIYITLPDRKVQMFDRDFDTYMAAISQFASACREWIGDADIQIAIENTAGFFPYEQRAIDRLLQEDCFVLTWDIGHSKETGEADLSFLLAHQGKLRHFHIHDGRELPPKCHLALGEGEIDLPARLQLARDTGSRCVLETKTVDALKHSVTWLRQQGL